MKRVVLVLAVAGLLAPSAQVVAMQRMRSTGAAAKARAQKAGEAASEKLSEWTGSLMYQVGRAIGRQRYDQLATIIKKHEKRAKGIVGAAAVLAIVAVIANRFEVSGMVGGVRLEGVTPAHLLKLRLQNMRRRPMNSERPTEL